MINKIQRVHCCVTELQKMVSLQRGGKLYIVYTKMRAQSVLIHQRPVRYSLFFSTNQSGQPLLCLVGASHCCMYVCTPMSYVRFFKHCRLSLANNQPIDLALHPSLHTLQYQLNIMFYLFVRLYRY